MHVQVKKNLKGADGARSYTPSVIHGLRTYTPADGPFEVDERKAQELIKQGLVDAVVRMPESLAQKAVNMKQAERR